MKCCSGCSRLLRWICSGFSYCNSLVILRESYGKYCCHELWASGLCHCDLKLLWSEHTACNNCSSTLPSKHSYLWTLPKNVSPPETRNGKENKVMHEREEITWRKAVKTKEGRRTESRWNGAEDLMFYSQDNYWDVKHEADVAVWSDSSWKAATATCWLLIGNSSLPLGNTFPFFF